MEPPPLAGTTSSGARYLRGAARARLAVASPAVRRGQADVVAQLLDLDAEGVEALAGLGDAALVEAEREALAADRAWATERTGRGAHRTRGRAPGRRAPALPRAQRFAGTG